MPRIFARSPFIINIDGTGAATTSLEVFIWNGSTAPTIPTYSISKNVVSTSQPMTYYNISPYVQEFISHELKQNIVSTEANTPTAQYCNVQVILYADRYVIETRLYKAYNGFGYYAEGQNPQLSPCLLSQNTTYNYLVGTPSIVTAGHITVEGLTGWSANYYDDQNNLLGVTTLGADNVTDFPLVYNPTGYDEKAVKLEIENTAGTVVGTYYLKAISECKYEPVIVDFVNKFGAWQRMFLFKASYDSMETTQDEYNLLQADLVDYDILEGQKKQFNTNGKESIKANSGWVDENFKVQVKELMLSERILVNNKPAKTRTKTLDFVKHINQNLINYTLEFDMNYETINSVV